MSKSISKFMEKLGAPLLVTRQSWGGVRGDGTIVLRVWQHRRVWHEGQLCMSIDRSDSNEGYGRRERRGHIARIEAGAPCLMVMQQDTEKNNKRTEDFNDRELFVGGKLRRVGDEVLIEVVGKVPA